MSAALDELGGAPTQPGSAPAVSPQDPLAGVHFSDIKTDYQFPEFLFCLRCQVCAVGLEPAFKGLPIKEDKNIPDVEDQRLDPHLASFMR
jgi:hypothetical protein